jgi:hypothetical protein
MAMKSTPSTEIPPVSQESVEAMPLEMVKAIRADTFDFFIEEQLQKNCVDREQSADVVCHVY